jgi:hypothetical protein
LCKTIKCPLLIQCTFLKTTCNTMKASILDKGNKEGHRLSLPQKVLVKMEETLSHTAPKNG